MASVPDTRPLWSVITTETWLIRGNVGDAVSYIRKTAGSFDAAAEKQRSGDWEGALHDWEAVVARWPKDIVGLSNVAACARELGRLDYAGDVIDRALRQFPGHAGVIAQAALIEERRGRWGSSAKYWEAIVHTRRAPLSWCHCYVHNLLILGRLDEADALLKTWTARFPENAGFMALAAMIASERKNLDEALALWSAYRLRYPDDPVGWEHYGRVYQARQNALIESSGEQAIDIVTLESVERHEDAETSRLLQNFESIGHDCEFGLVQRRFGAEPVGLLRFNSVAYGDLVTAVANGFAQMGEPETTELITVSNGEFFVQDRRWRLGMHTFVFEGQQPADVLFGKLCRRVAFLRDKFLSDLAEGRKILVFTSPGLAQDDLVMLHRAFRSLGPVKLLHVAYGTASAGGFPDVAPGSVAALDDGLFVGRLTREGRTASGAWDIAFDEWVSVCEQVRDLAGIAP